MELTFLTLFRVSLDNRYSSSVFKHFYTANWQEVGTKTDQYLHTIYPCEIRTMTTGEVGFDNHRCQGITAYVFTCVIDSIKVKNKI